MNEPNYTKDGFTFFKANSDFATELGDPIVLNDVNRLSVLIAYIKKKGVKWIQIRDEFVNDLEFFNEIPHIEGITILTNDVDLSGLKYLKKLKILSFNKSTSILDLSMFDDLLFLNYSDNRKIKNLETCKTLKVLNIEGYKKSDLQEFRNLELLQSVSLSYSRNLTTLNGLENLKNIKSIHIHSASNLTDLNGLNEKNICLETLDIYSTKKLIDYSSISKLKNLKNLYIRKSGDIINLSILLNSKNIEKVAIGVKVLDGDMSLLKKVPLVSFINYPHYTHKHKGIGFFKLE